MSRYQMYKYVLEPQAEENTWLLRIWMCDTYSPILIECFPDIPFNCTSGTSGTCISKLTLDQNQILTLQSLLEVLKKHVLLVKNKYISPFFSDELDECYALAFNFEENFETGEREYTNYGRLEHLAKEQRSDDARKELVKAFANIYNNHPLYSRAEIIMPIPPNPSKTFHLPILIARELSAMTVKTDGSDMIRKTKETPRLQGLPIEEKPEALKDAIEIVGNVHGKDIIIVDDLYQSGFTMWTVAKILKESGAKKVRGLACVKSWKDTDNV